MNFKSRVKQSEAIDGNELTISLTIEQLRESDRGVYECACIDFQRNQNSSSVDVNISRMFFLLYACNIVYV